VASPFWRSLLPCGLLLEPSKLEGFFFSQAGFGFQRNTGERAARVSSSRRRGA
jgi:hypothetical protein